MDWMITLLNDDGANSVVSIRQEEVGYYDDREQVIYVDGVKVDRRRLEKFARRLVELLENPSIEETF